MVSALGAASVTSAVRDATAAGVTALTLATVSDLAVLRPDPVAGLRAHRDFGPGEAYADHRRQLEAIGRAVPAAGVEVASSAVDINRAARDGRNVVAECNRLGIVVDCAHASYAATLAVLETSDQPVIISHGQLGRPGAEHPRLLSTAHVAAVASAGGLIGAWPAGLTSRSLADFGTEITRLTDIAGPGHVAIGTDLDGNYRPVLTSYHQLADLAGLLLDRGLPAADVRGVLGGNAMDLLSRIQR